MIVNGYKIAPRANLWLANLREANLRRANLRMADLQHADLREANLREADLEWANLRMADLQHADLWGANLWRADLRGADLREANIDFSCWPLSCGSAGVIIDQKQAMQLMAHALNVSREFWPGNLSQAQIAWLNGFHRIQSGEFPAFK
jgi:uncharacterized protein YjbI with pentapeptide repeats